MRHLTNFFGLIILLTVTAESFGQSKDRKVTIIVKDPSKYSKTFIEGLRDIGPGQKFELIDDLIITDDKYRNSFSQLLPANKTVIVTGQKDGWKYELELNRVNYTTISYDFSVTDKKGTMTKESGLADKSPQFMLGSESDEDENGIGYFCSEYYAISKKFLYSVRIGIRGDNFLVRVTGYSEKLNLLDSPTLR
jgi:hypothetical protein